MANDFNQKIIDEFRANEGRVGGPFEDGTRTYAATATVLTGEDRDHVFAELAATNPGWADYQARTTRTIPVVLLHETA